jgi:hypothetical protein
MFRATATFGNMHRSAYFGTEIILYSIANHRYTRKIPMFWYKNHFGTRCPSGTPSLYLRGLIAVVCAHRPYFSVHHLPNAPRASLIMVSTPLLDFDHQKGFEIPTKHKEAIRQLHWFGEVPKLQLQERYHLGNTIINRILEYKTPEWKRPNRIGKPKKLTDTQVDVIIEYCSENYEQRCLDYDHLVLELKLDVTASILQQRLRQQGYFRCTVCQKPYLTAIQVIGRLLWAITHIFWTKEWLKVL